MNANTNGMPHPAERVESVRVPALDDILGNAFPVLDQGFIRAVDYMGSDAAIVQAARVSYGAGTKKISEDRGLIRFLMRHRHTTPFEMCELKLHIRIPMDAWRQMIRHRTASVNEYSTRYSVAIDAKQSVQDNEWRVQSKSNKQGSGGFVTEWPDGWLQSDGYGTETPGEFLSRREQEFHEHARLVYQERLDLDVAREVARKDLPLSTYTEAYWKIDLHNLFHYLSLRMDAHAQLEIRSYANIIGNEIVARWCPLAWEAFTDYRLDGMFLSGRDKAIVHALTKESKHAACVKAVEFGWLESYPGNKKLKSNRERDECEAKLKMLGLTTPWR